MPRYWVIAPVESSVPTMYQKVWDYDLANNLISIGWSELGDVSNFSQDALIERIAKTYPEKPKPTVSLIANMFHSFFHEVAVGDIVLARRGRMILSGIGTVTQKAFSNPELKRDPSLAGHTHDNWLGVRWHETGRNIKYRTPVFPMHTISRMTEESYQSLIGPVSPVLDSSIDEAIDSPSTIMLEKYLEEFIVLNFDTIFKDSVQIYSDSEGYSGQQYQTAIGRIDVLAVDPATKDFIVIELKKGQASDKVVGQILRYMGWVKKNLCQANQNVKGLIISESRDEKLEYAISMTRDIVIRYYKLSFELTDSPN